MDRTSMSDGWMAQLDLQDRALAATSEGITISDARQPDQPIIYANAGFERLTGYQVQDILGRNCRFLQGPGTDPTTVAQIRQALQAEREITVEIQNYRHDGKPFWNRLSITPVRDEVGQVSHFIGVQSDITTRKLAEEALQRTTQELARTTARLKRNLRAAAKIQRAWLPKRMPKVKGVQFSYTFHPCEELAGDSLNVFHLDENHLGMYTLDVSGHGVSAALLSVTLNRWLTPTPGQSCLFNQRPRDLDQDEGVKDRHREMNPRGRKSHHTGDAETHRYVLTPPAQVLEELNRQFPIDPETGQYFTIVYGILDLRDHTFRYANAGHPSIVLLRLGRALPCPPDASFPVGFVPKPAYTEQTLHLEPGDRLYFYSDGVVEAVNGEQKELGTDRLLNELIGHGDRSVQESLTEVVSLVEKWSETGRIEDDVSLLALEIEAP